LEIINGQLNRNYYTERFSYYSAAEWILCIWT